MFRFLGLGIMLCAAASTAMAGEHYVEVWNPPEARVGKPHCAVVARRPVASRHIVPHAMKARTRTAPAPVGRLVAKSDRRESVPAHAPDMSEIPRQITPEGNVLRVSSGGVTPGVTR
ncbi:MULTISPECIES: hypothetical protein [unclassified Paraburkholderia]|uniref:hypothetical protein n=1 Tax=unclassified Paraburkholderia TaxID=2615204 RepID=UPI000EAC6412|nr:MULTISPECIES: hypothetical protein [unclassified Paraburkholderia]RKR46203.1 hypothetical protein B0G82_3884 [Paraburkholderia sp. BL17N1]TDY26047.1 hypothetical protein B0G81_6547 [Paraburkholderia sp. BL6665CI2N2]